MSRIWVFFIFLHLSLVHGFLYDSDFSKPINGQNKLYLTMSEFIDERDHMQRQFQQKLSVLAFQLREMFAALEQKILAQTVCKETGYTFGKLEKQVEVLTLNYTILQHEFAVLQQKYDVNNKELRQMQNITRHSEMELENLKHLQSISPLQELNSLQKQMESINSQTQSLQQNQHARNDEFKALYNETILSRQMITEMKENFRDLTSRMEVRYNSTSLEELRHQMKESREKVALLSSGLSQLFSSGSTILFPYVKYSEGIQPSLLKTFTSTGKYSCEKEGLYLISATVNSSTSGSWFIIRKNNTELSRTYIAHFGSGSWHSSTGVVAATLQMNDTISVETGVSMQVDGGTSSMTLVKIK